MLRAWGKPLAKDHDLDEGSAEVVLKATLLVLLTILLSTVGVIAYGKNRWRDRSHLRRAGLEAARGRVTRTTYDADEISSLPSPVQRYLRAALEDGQPIVATVRLSHAGTFNLSDRQQNWRPFTSTQVVTTHPPAFDWDGAIRLAPGLAVFVHDTYLEEQGYLQAKVLGLIEVADLRETPEIAQGELMRYLAEAVWYPTALLPSQGVLWQPIDECSALATIEDGSNSASLEFRFAADGLVREVVATARYRAVDGGFVATPWSGSFTAYEVRNGLRIPMKGEVAWNLPEGPMPYWRGRVTGITHEFAPR